jgi:hypothetical protein
MDAVGAQDRGFLTERGWRSGREPPEKEKSFNYARRGVTVTGDGKVGSS